MHKANPRTEFPSSQDTAGMVEQCQQLHKLIISVYTYKYICTVMERYTKLHKSFPRDKNKANARTKDIGSNKHWKLNRWYFHDDAFVGVKNAWVVGIFMVCDLNTESFICLSSCVHSIQKCQQFKAFASIALILNTSFSFSFDPLLKNANSSRVLHQLL